LGHVVCKDGLLVKIVAISDMVAPTFIHDICATLGHIEYYQKFIHNYAKVTTPLEKLLCKDTK